MKAVTIYSEMRHKDKVSPTSREATELNKQRFIPIFPDGERKLKRPLVVDQFKVSFNLI